MLTICTRLLKVFLALTAPLSSITQVRPLKQDNNAKTITVTVKPNVKWSDGQPVVARDLVYAYEIIANKASKSQRYTESCKILKG